jgi:hypothetical protein
VSLEPPGFWFDVIIILGAAAELGRVLISQGFF